MVFGSRQTPCCAADALEQVQITGAEGVGRQVAAPPVDPGQIRAEQAIQIVLVGLLPLFHHGALLRGAGLGHLAQMEGLEEVMRTKCLAAEVLRVEELEGLVLVIGDDAQHLGPGIQEVAIAGGAEVVTLEVGNPSGQLLMDQLEGRASGGQVRKLLPAEKGA